MDHSDNWIKIADTLESIEFNDKGIALCIVEHRKICIIKTPAGVKACTDVCPHAGSSLSEGFIDQHLNIVCCAHNYKFNLNSGRDSMNEGYFLKRFPVRIKEEGIFIQL